MIENWLERKQQEFDALSPEEQKEETEKAHKEAVRIKENVELYVSPEDIVPGMNTEGIKRMSEAFRNKPVKDKGKEHPGEVGEDYKTPFAGEVFRALEYDLEENEGKKFNAVKELFKDIPVIDLGPADSVKGKTIADMLGSSGYIGVEPYNWRSLQRNMICYDESDLEFYLPDKIKKPEKIKYSIIPEDALTFLRRLPDHSVGVITAGTDYYVFYGGNGTSWEQKGDSQEERRRKKIVTEYIEKCKKEIARVLHPKSALLATESVFQNVDNSEDLFISEEETIFATKENNLNGFYIIKSKAE